jgi:flagellar biosynthesis protein FlhG
MSDQAATLRVLRGGNDRDSTPPPPRRRSLAVTGGKGGVGKSTIALNLALAYAGGGARTLVVDGDLGMADLNLLLGVAPDKSLLDALGDTPIDDILVSAHGVELLPALNGSYLLSTVGPSGQRRVIELVGSLADRFDTLVIDIAAGIGQSQTLFGGTARDVVVVVNPEPLSMADAYACMKVLAAERAIERAFVIPNRVTSRVQADELVARLTALVTRFLDIELVALPPVPADLAVSDAAQVGIPLLVHRPDAPAARAIRQIARAIDQLATRDAETASWWRSRTRARGGT